MQCSGSKIEKIIGKNKLRYDLKKYDYELVTSINKILLITS